MPSILTRTVTNVLCSLRIQEVSSYSPSYKQDHNRSNKKEIQIIEKAEMLDYEDCAWM
ncbi:hypothetical protein M422DRAFT_254774 [Sphaerobolus stellatus SS14]|uniref:Uncharacterized protein n=1 Tax=Sphaerobolus stellatus (strain SS14) TaxID=990650 RepID=A0A0C9V5A6_SPHS4|nr:hypothetical protein M422DRAFT_254774 [Sphaerobolus stellatus SS14]